MIDLNLLPTLHPQAAARRVGGQMLVVLADRGEVMVLNESGAAFWDWIDGAHSGAELAALLEEHYGLPTDEAIQDTDEFLQSLIEMDAINLVEANMGTGGNLAQFPIDGGSRQC
jgi:hypothetical protein